MFKAQILHRVVILCIFYPMLSLALCIIYCVVAAPTLGMISNQWNDWADTKGSQGQGQTLDNLRIGCKKHLSFTSKTINHSLTHWLTGGTVLGDAIASNNKDNHNWVTGFIKRALKLLNLLSGWKAPCHQITWITSTDCCLGTGNMSMRWNQLWCSSSPVCIQLQK